MAIRISFTESTGQEKINISSEYKDIDDFQRVSREISDQINQKLTEILVDKGDLPPKPEKKVKIDRN